MFWDYTVERMFEQFNPITKPYIKLADNANVITDIFWTSLIIIRVIRAEPPFVYLFIVCSSVSYNHMRILFNFLYNLTILINNNEVVISN